MKRRRYLVGLALSAAAFLGVSGCSYLTPQATLKHYDPSDGVGASLGSDLLLRNVMLVASGPELGNLVMVVVKNGSSAQNAQETQIRVGVKGGGEILTGTLPQAYTPFGFNDNQRLLLSNLGASPGGLSTLVFEAGGSSLELEVPVLDGKQPEYHNLLPSPSVAPAPDSNPEPASSHSGNSH